jgi:BASS family bile acid:Na+ symporter
MVRHVKLVFALVVIHNMLAMVAGYYWAKWNQLPEADARAISMETGVQNSGLGLVFVFSFFPQLGGMMLIVAFWAIWDLVSSFAVALYWDRKPIK